MSEYYKLRAMVKHWEGAETKEYNKAKIIVENGGATTAEKINDKQNVNSIKWGKRTFTIKDGIKEMRRLRRKLVEQK